MTGNGDEVAKGVPEGSREERLMVRTHRLKQAAIGLGIIFLIVAMAGSAWAFYTQTQVLHAVRETQTQTAPLTHSIARTDDRVVALQRQISGCVTPGEPCYQQALKHDQATIAAIVGGTNEAALFYAYCADRPGHQSLAGIKTCADALLHPHH